MKDEHDFAQTLLLPKSFGNGRAIKQVAILVRLLFCYIFSCSQAYLYVDNDEVV